MTARRRRSNAPNHDGNMFSFYYRSRLDFHLGERAALRQRDPA